MTELLITLALVMGPSLALITIAAVVFWIME